MRATRKGCTVSSRAFGLCGAPRLEMKRSGRPLPSRTRSRRCSPSTSCAHPPNNGNKRLLPPNPLLVDAEGEELGLWMIAGPSRQSASWRWRRRRSASVRSSRAATTTATRGPWPLCLRWPRRVWSWGSLLVCSTDLRDVNCYDNLREVMIKQPADTNNHTTRKLKLAKLGKLVHRKWSIRSSTHSSTDANTAWGVVQAPLRRHRAERMRRRSPHRTLQS